MWVLQIVVWVKTKVDQCVGRFYMLHSHTSAGRLQRQRQKQHLKHTHKTYTKTATKLLISCSKHLTIFCLNKQVLAAWYCRNLIHNITSCTACTRLVPSHTPSKFGNYSTHLITTKIWVCVNFFTYFTNPHIENHPQPFQMWQRYSLP